MKVSFVSGGMCCACLYVLSFLFYSGHILEAFLRYLPEAMHAHEIDLDVDGQM